MIRSDLGAVTLWFVFTRTLVVAAAFLGAAHPNPGYHLQSLGGPDAPSYLAPFVRWDAAYYIDLARNGYPPWDYKTVYHAAFFPLYPMAIRAVDGVLHETVLSAMLIANVCALGAALLLARLGGRMAAYLFLASPGAGFLSFPYSESLYCLLIVAGLWAVLSERPLLAASLGALASASRPTGLVVGVALLVVAWQQRRDLARALFSVGCAALSTLGLLAYMRFCSLRYGDPLYFAHLQSNWGRHTSLLGPVRAFTEFRFDPDYYVVAIAAIAGAVWMMRRASPVLAISAWFLILVPLSTGSLKSIIRFQGANMPLLAGLGPALHGRVRTAVLSVSLLLMVYEVAWYARGFAHN